MVYKIFDKNSTSLTDKSAKGSGIKSMPNQQLANELHKSIIRKFKKRRVYSSFKHNICDFDLADMQLISKYNKGIRFLFCAIDLFSKYAWVVHLKVKKGVTIVNAFQSIFNSLKREPNKLHVDQGSEFYNCSFKKRLKGNGIKMYPAHNEGKSVVTERFIRALKNKIFKLMTAVLKNVSFDVLDGIVDEYNNTYH